MYSWQVDLSLPHRPKNIRRRFRPTKRKEIRVAAAKHTPFTPPAKMTTQHHQSHKVTEICNHKKPVLSKSNIKIYYLNHRGLLPVWCVFILLPQYGHITNRHDGQSEVTSCGKTTRWYHSFVNKLLRLLLVLMCTAIHWLRTYVNAVRSQFSWNNGRRNCWSDFTKIGTFHLQSTQWWEWTNMSRICQRHARLSTLTPSTKLKSLSKHVQIT